MKEKDLTPISKEDFKDEVNSLTSEYEDMSPLLKLVLQTSELIKQRKGKDIQFSEPILRQNGNPVFFPNTINLIQGQAGVHKSRLVENICAAFLKRPQNDNELLGFTRTSATADYTVVYVDTERNFSEQLPYAMQSILVNAGYDKSENPDNFYYISLLQVERKDRFKVLQEYFQHLRKNTQNPMFIVLDVSTDCIEDFNRTDKSMELIDLMNMAVNEYNIVFLCLIHENPGSEKARGHFGTELMNKSSTSMQIGFEKDANKNNTDIIRVKFKKCRSTIAHMPIFMKYCAEKRGLVLADVAEINKSIDSRKQKAKDEELFELLISLLGEGEEISRQSLIDKLCEELEVKSRTVESRLKEIVENELVIREGDSKLFTLVKCKKSKEIVYRLIPCAA